MHLTFFSLLIHALLSHDSFSPFHIRSPPACGYVGGPPVPFPPSHPGLQGSASIFSGHCTSVCPSVEAALCILVHSHYFPLLLPCLFLFPYFYAMQRRAPMLWNVSACVFLKRRHALSLWGERGHVAKRSCTPSLSIRWHRVKKPRADVLQWVRVVRLLGL